MGLLLNLKAALFPAGTDADSPPAWIERLKDSKFVSISGVEVPFLYLDLSSFYPLKTTSFGSVDGNGAYIQQNGIDGLRFPCAMIFTGSNNDLQAKIAVQAITEVGEGTLYHPTHGPINVAPSGEIEQLNAYVSAANETIVTVEFLETTGLLIDNLPPFESVFDNYLELSADVFESGLNLEDPADEVSFANNVQRVLGTVKSTLDKLSDGVEVVQSEIDDTFDSINNSIDILVKQPLMLARQVQNLILTPARRTTLIKSNLAAYKNLAASIFGNTPKPNRYDYTAQNNFAFDLLVGGACVSAFANSANQNEFTKKKEFIDAASDLSSLADDYSTFADDGAGILDIAFGNSDWQELLNLSAITVSILVNGSFAALTELRLTTDTERAAIDWCFELFGSTHNNVLWQFAEANNLGGDELLIIPVNRELVYYA